MRWTNESLFPSSLRRSISICNEQDRPCLDSTLMTTPLRRIDRTPRALSLFACALNAGGVRASLRDPPCILDALCMVQGRCCKQRQLFHTRPKRFRRPASCLCSSLSGRGRFYRSRHTRARMVGKGSAQMRESALAARGDATVPRSIGNMERLSPHTERIQP